VATKDFKLNIERRDGVGTTVRSKCAPRKNPRHHLRTRQRFQPISVEAKALDDLLHHGGRTTLITLVDGSKTETALIREVQRNEVSHRSSTPTSNAFRKRSRSRKTVRRDGRRRGRRERTGRRHGRDHARDRSRGPASRLPDNLEVDVTALAFTNTSTRPTSSCPKASN